MLNTSYQWYHWWNQRVLKSWQNCSSLEYKSLYTCTCQQEWQHHLKWRKVMPTRISYRYQWGSVGLQRPTVKIKIRFKGHLLGPAIFTSAVERLAVELSLLGFELHPYRMWDNALTNCTITAATRKEDLTKRAAVTWLKYCRNGVKLYPINQSYKEIMDFHDIPIVVTP